MIELLGLESEVNTVTICWIICGASVGLWAGAFAGAGGKEKTFHKILKIICLTVFVVAFCMQIISAVILFFTFQWGCLLKSVFAGTLIGAGMSGLSYIMAIGIRKKKYAGNPITKNAVRFCKQNEIAGVLCYCDRICFFTDIADTKICNSQSEVLSACSTADAKVKQSQYQGPDGLYAMLNSGTCVGEIQFKKEGYEELPDVKMFASALAKKMGGCRYAHHHAQVEHISGNTKYIDHIYDGCFVYKKKAYQKKRKKEKERAKLHNRIMVNEEKKRKTWE